MSAVGAVRRLAVPAVVFVCLLFLRGPQPALATVPPNDNRADAIAITTPVPSGLAAVGTNFGATLETGAGEFDVYGGCQGYWYPNGVKTYVPNTTFDKTIWYKWTSPGTAGTIVMDTYGSNVDTTLGVWTGATYATQVGQECSDAFLVADRSALVLDYVANTTYYIQIGVWPGSPAGTIRLNLTTGAMMVVDTNNNDQINDTVLSLNQAIRLARGTTIYAGMSPDEQDKMLEGAKAGSTSSDLIHFWPGFNFLIGSGLPDLSASNDHITGIGPKASGNSATITAPGITCLPVSGGGNQISGMFFTDCGTGIDVQGSSNLIGGSQDGVLGNRFRGTASSSFGIQVSGASNGIRGNVIGSDHLDPAAHDWGVRIVGEDADNNLIGGSEELDRNVVSGNDLYGIEITGGADNTTVRGNFIGLSTNGAHAVPNTLGVQVNSTGGASTGNSVYGNHISGNSIGASIFGQGSEDNTVYSNIFGLAGDDFTPMPNDRSVDIAGGADNNTIGDAGSSSQYIGDSTTGVRIDGAGTTGNAVIKNVIVNNTDGVKLSGGATGNTVGGSFLGNTINNNANAGVLITDGLTTGNVVSGNSVGGNYYGVLIESAASGNVAGPATAGSFPNERNVINNNTYGVYISGGAALNRVRGNYVGLAADGATPEPNVIGVWLSSGASQNTIGGSVAGEGNVISGNTNFGVELLGDATTGNIVSGNLIGTDSAGGVAVGNGVGVYILNGADSNDIGGNDAAERNVISGNSTGVYVSGAQTSQNVIRGNYIGTNAAGTAALGNLGYGISMDSGAHNNTIGGPNAGEGNVISGNGWDGVRIKDGGAPQQYAYIGSPDAIPDFGGGSASYVINVPAGPGRVIDVNAQVCLTHTYDNDLDIFLRAPNLAVIELSTDNGGDGDDYCSTLFDDEAASSIMTGAPPFNGSYRPEGSLALFDGIDPSGNWQLEITDDSAPDTGLLWSWHLTLTVTNNVIQGNYIGTNAAGTAALGNGVSGIMLDNAFNNTIGGSGAARNVISGNAQNGIWMTGGAAFNAVQGNYIGTDATGAADLGNGHSGLWLEGATDNTIGGTGFGEENVISGNQLAGVAVTGGGARNLVRANRIGLNAAGTTAMGNSGDGVLLQDASYNMVGETGKGNNIAGNGGSGVYVSETAGSSLGNQVVGNAIGVTTSGAAAGNSGAGVYVGFGTDADVIGGLDPFSANLISANGGDGVFLAGINHQVLGNYIGTAPGGLTGMGNGGNGVSVVGINHDIGGSAAGAGNLIAFNVGAGIYGASGLNSNTLSRNRIHSNGSLGIEIDPAGVSGPKPELFFAAVGGGTTFISSGLTASPSTQYRIEYFHSVACDSSGFGEGQTYLGSFDVTTSPGGSISFGPTLGTAAPAASFITATATDLFTGDTTEFSNCIPAFDDADDDDDGITDANEQGVTLTSPTNPDTDADTVIDGSDNCPLWPNTSQTLPPWPVPPGDSDCDGFANTAEGTLGTVATQQCPVAGNPDAWPPDFNKSRSVSVTDVLAMKPFFGQAVPPAPARYDLVQSNSIGITDVLELKDYFGKSCT